MAHGINTDDFWSEFNTRRRLRALSEIAIIIIKYEHLLSPFFNKKFKFSLDTPTRSHCSYIRYGHILSEYSTPTVIPNLSSV
jgi:hypothetical protein